MAEGAQIIDSDAAPDAGTSMADQLERVYDKLQELEFAFLNASGSVDGLPGKVVSLDHRLKDLFAILMEDGGLDAGELDGLSEQVAELSEQIRDSQLAEAEVGGSLSTALEPLGAALAELIERPIGITNGALDDLARRADVEALGAAIGPVRDALAEFAARPAGVTEAALAPLATGEDVAAIREAIAPLRDTLEELAARPPGLSEGALEHLREDIAGLSAAFEPLKDVLAQMSDAPAGSQASTLDGLATRDDLLAIQELLHDVRDALRATATRDDTAALLDRLTTDADAHAGSDEAPVVATKDDVDALQRAVSAVATLDDLAALLEPIVGRQSEQTQDDVAPAPATKDDVEAVLGALRDALGAVVTREDIAPLLEPEAGVDEAAPSEVASALGEVRAALDSIATRDDLTALLKPLIVGEDDAAEGPGEAPKPATKDDVIAALAEVAAGTPSSEGLSEDTLEGLARREDVVALRAAMGRFKNTLAELSAKPDGVSSDALKDLATKSDVLALGDALRAAAAPDATDGAPLREEIAALAATVGQVATRDDVVALGASVEALKVEQGALAARPVEVSADVLAGLATTEDIQAALSAHAPDIGALKDAVDALAPPSLGGLATAEGVAALAQEMAAVREENAALCARVEGLTTAIETMVRRPDPVLDLAPQRELFARYVTVLDTLAGRIENAAARFETEDLAALRSAFEQLPVGAAPLDDDAAVATILEAVNKIAMRPDPVIDLTEQRASFAAFNAALGKALGRLEASTAALERADPPAAPDVDAGAQTPAEVLTALLETNRKLAEAASRGPADYPDSALIRDLRFALAEAMAGARQADPSQA